MPFCVGNDPRVNAQFSAQYCAANAIVRRWSQLAHFRPEQVADGEVGALVERVTVISDEALDERGHTAVDVRVTMQDGAVHERKLRDIAPGYPGNDLLQDLAAPRHSDCMAYAARPLGQDQVDSFLGGVEGIAAFARREGRCWTTWSWPEDGHRALLGHQFLEARLQLAAHGHQVELARRGLGEQLVLFLDVVVDVLAQHLDLGVVQLLGSAIGLDLRDQVLGAACSTSASSSRSVSLIASRAAG